MHALYGRCLQKSAVLIKKLKKQYSIVENEESKDILNRKDIRTISKDSLQDNIISINDSNIKQETFVEYLKNRRNKPIYVFFEMFKNQEILAYYKKNLVNTEPEYANVLKEYEDGLLLFELMQQKIWNKSSKDTLGLKNYYTSNISKYKKEYDKIKGEVMNDYQTYLEKNWIADLRNKSAIEVNKTQLKKLINSYNKK